MHRDPSDNNIIFRRVYNVPGDKTQGSTVTGVLCDWDLAQFDYSEEPPYLCSHRFAPETEDAALETLVEEDEGAADQPEKPAVQVEECESAQERPRHRTGTGPFLALELLQQSDMMEPTHVYRYDLESFFYVLIWFCILFQPKEKSYKHSKYLSKWEIGCFSDMALSKHFFFAGDGEVHTACASISSEYLPLKFKWITPLWNLFEEALGNSQFRRRANNIPKGTPEYFQLMVEIRKF